MVAFKIKSNKREGNTVRLEVEIEERSVREERARVVEGAAQRVPIPGFRKGKAPKDLVLKQLDPKAILEQTLEILVQQMYPEVVAQAVIQPVDSPNLEVEDFPEAGPMKLKFTCTVYPEVKLGKYKGIKVSRPASDVRPEEVDRVFGELRESFARLDPIEGRAAGKGDIIVFDMETTVEGRKVSPLSGKGIRMAIGDSRLPEAFDAGLVGTSLGDQLDIAYDCPNDFWLPELAGKKAEAKVHVKELHMKRLPELTDEFCKTYLQSENVEKARQDIEKRLSESKNRNADAQSRDELIRKIVEDMHADIPDVMVERELDVMLREMDEDWKKDRMDLETYLKRTRKTLEDLRRELRDTASARVKSKVALRAIAQSEKIHPTDEEKKEEMERLAQLEGKDPEQFVREVGKNGEEFVEDFLIRRKTLDFLVSKAKIEQRKEEAVV